MKGQWFLISAVIASSAFLAISFLFKSYFVADPGEIARSNEDYYFHNVVQQFDRVINQSECSDMEKNAREFRSFAEREIGSLGYLLYMNYTIINCAQKEYELGVLLASDRMILCKKPVTVNDILPDSVQLSCT